MHTDLIVSQADARPLYLQLMEQIRQRVAAGDWPPGYELPSIRELAADVRVSVITIKRAYLELEREGVIVTRQGKGSFVAEGTDLGTEIRRRELDEHLRAAAQLAQLLGLSAPQLEARLREIHAELEPKEKKA